MKPVHLSRSASAIKIGTGPFLTTESSPGGSTGGKRSTFPDVNVGSLVEAARKGRFRAIAQLLSLVEQDHPQLPEITAALIPHAAGAAVIGLTGPPGSGKSTTTSMLVSAFRAEGRRVGVLAIDPSSPFSGGALLGDRIRMTQHATDTGVFIRSMATRGHLGGLSWATPQAVRVLDASGFDVILIETVGVGQSEIDIAKLADTTVVLLAPGLGDAVQAAKAGVLEIADVFVVNKADRDGADEVARDLKQMVSFGRTAPAAPSWRQPIVKAVASRDEGAKDILDALRTHREWIERHGELENRQVDRAAGELESIVLSRLRIELDRLPGGEKFSAVARDVARGTLDPYEAADRLLTGLGLGSEQVPSANEHLQ